MEGGREMKMILGISVFVTVCHLPAMLAVVNVGCSFI